MRKQLLVTAFVSSVLLLSACGPLTPSPTDSGEPSASTSAEPSVTPTSAEPAPATPAATVVGTCTNTSPDRSIPTIYVAFTDDATTPVTMTYTAFNADGTAPLVTETVTGPVVTRVTYACTDNNDSVMWTFTVSSGGSRIGCTQSFGGQIVDSDAAGEGTPATADCTGNPGM